MSKHFAQKRVLKEVSLTYSSGVLGIAGCNGSGKSTLMQCLAGLERPSTGTVEWYANSQPIDKISLKTHLGYAAPYVSLYPELSCIENLQFLMKLRNSNDAKNLIKQTLTITGLADLGPQLFSSLSTGQQQRLRLAAAIVHQPYILMLDEPGSNLDEKGRLLIQSIVSEFRESNKLIIIASNNPDELELCDEVYSVEGEKFM